MSRVDSSQHRPSQGRQDFRWTTVLARSSTEEDEMAMSGGSNAEINVTPMIDVLLVLLIIFMVIQPTTPRGVEARALQSSQSADPALPPERTIVLQIEGGPLPVYKINGRTLAKRDVVPELRSVFAVRQEKTMFVKGDKALDFGQIAEAVGMGAEANATVGLLTPRSEVGN
jgi:biopolymer transport protein TolR